mgnify:FL=1
MRLGDNVVLVGSVVIRRGARSESDLEDRRTPQTAAVMCPECGAALAQAAQLHEGEQVMCKHCDARLEVIRLLPLELDWVYAEAYQAPE